MKRANILITLLCGALAFGAPLFAQDALESDMERIAEDTRRQAEAAAQPPQAPAAPAEQAPAAQPAQPQTAAEKPEQKAKGMAMSEPPKRYFEIGVDVTGGVANNGLSISELFREEIVLDIPVIRDKVKEKGMNTVAPFLGNVFLNINFGDFLGLGIFTKMEGDINFTVGSALLDFLADGNIKKHNLDGEAVNVAGGVFMETGIRSFLHLDRWTFTASPALYIPVVYIPKSTLEYELSTDKNFALKAEGNIDVYTPFSLQDMNFSEAIDLSQAGFDLTVGAEFGLFKWLYIGGTANHIPIVPSTPTNKTTITGDALGISINNPLSNPEIEMDTEVKQTYSTNTSEKVRRPLTFDIYAKWKLLDMSLLKFTLKPNLGFTTLTASGAMNFNWGVQADLNLLKFLSLQLGTGLNQDIWKHRAGIGINLRILELLAEASLQSTDFLSSFNANGLAVGVGVRLGF